jgi:hypothetical protein
MCHANGKECHGAAALSAAPRLPLPGQRTGEGRVVVAGGRFPTDAPPQSAACPHGACCDGANRRPPPLLPPAIALSARLEE